jgi:phosphoribosylglycinamide formyltransferase-1
VVTRALPAVALVSGRGTNLEALLASRDAGWLPLDLRAVLSNHPHARALERARGHGVEPVVVDQRDHGEREAFDRAMAAAIDRYEPALVILAGFMRILTTGFVERYADRMINIHPSLLPELRGLDTHARALAAGVAHHGASVHFVTAELDAGPVAVQARVRVRDHDNAETLAARVLEREHRIYPLAIRWIAEGRLAFDGTKAWLDGQPLTAPVVDPPEADDVPLPTGG